ncbi:hypothetical protein AC579_4157 [Pseudocercospora musae]|uniref:F-box domain-containing protein n=1 Tax=Pseudocercospora musae TaxID=113226 RepID=A0A139IFV9_9PEZI|nr:hypothetical protein AC579_4157 [Pseudocercospora musae]
MPTQLIASRKKSKLHRASAEVFAAPELLERILLELPCFQLFILQRTCIQLRDIIKDSSTLQQFMFLQAKPLSSSSPVESKTIMNPLLSQMVIRPSETFEEIDGLYFSQASLAQDDIQDRTLDLFICSETNGWRPWLHRLGTTPRNASLTRMLVSQPPPSNFFTKLHAQPRFSQEKKKKVEVNFTSTHGQYLGNGFTLGEVVDELDQSYGRFVDVWKRKKQVNRRDLRIGRNGAGMWRVRGSAVLDGLELAPSAREMLRGRSSGRMT